MATVFFAGAEDCAGPIATVLDVSGSASGDAVDSATGCAVPADKPSVASGPADGAPNGRLSKPPSVLAAGSEAPEYVVKDTFSQRARNRIETFYTHYFERGKHDCNAACKDWRAFRLQSGKLEFLDMTRSDDCVTQPT